MIIIACIINLYLLYSTLKGKLSLLHKPQEPLAILLDPALIMHLDSMFVNASAFTNCTLTIKASQASREPTTLAATEATEMDQPGPNAVTARWPPPIKTHSGGKLP